MKRGFFRSEEGYRAVMAWYDRMLARIPVPYEARMVPSRFGDTHVVSAGPVDAPPVVYLHGLGTNACSIPEAYGVIGRRMRIHAVDVIGEINRSAQVRPPCEGPDYALWIGDVLDGLGIGKARFAGVSFGAWITLKLATIAPERIERASLVIPAGIVPIAARGAALLAYYWAMSLLRPDEPITTLLNRDMAPPGLGVLADIDSLSALESKHYDVDTRALWPPRLGDANPLRPFRRDELARFDAPVQVVAGRFDPLFPWEDLVRTAGETLPSLSHVVIERRLGHIPAREGIADILERVAAFLEKGDNPL
jgi:pimeloyl-ACP methyl ester carboxylesterase